MSVPEKHFMLDIETLSTTVEAAVLSIGAVEFDPITGQILDEFYKELRLQDQKKRDIDPETVKWWVKQVMEDPTRANVFLNDNKAPVRNVLLLLRDFLGEGKKNVWACDPDFDCAILTNLYTEYQLSVPWSYYEPKSVRTVRKLAKLKGLEAQEAVKTHNALDDCKRQVAEIVAFTKSCV